MELDGKVAFVTGGSGDIGGAIAISLAKAGVDVAVSYVGDSQRAAATVDAVKKIGRRSLAVQLDQRDSNSVDTSVKKVMAEFGRLDILVNNAGCSWVRKLNIGPSRRYASKLRPSPPTPPIRRASSRTQRRGSILLIALPSWRSGPPAKLPTIP
jgi:NAD(P)-dependent dehydrogenase (short-subunit alcohol dehydrogenase family)